MVRLCRAIWLQLWIIILYGIASSGPISGKRGVTGPYFKGEGVKKSTWFVNDPLLVQTLASFNLLRLLLIFKLIKAAQ